MKAITVDDSRMDSSCQRRAGKSRTSNSTVTAWSRTGSIRSMDPVQVRAPSSTVWSPPRGSGTVGQAAQLQSGGTGHGYGVRAIPLVDPAPCGVDIIADVQSSGHFAGGQVLTEGAGGVETPAGLHESKMHVPQGRETGWISGIIRPR